MNIVSLLILVAMIFGLFQYRRKKSPWARPLVGILGIMLIVLVVGQIISALRTPQKERDLIIENELQSNEYVMEYLGDYLGANFPGHKLLLITRSQSPASKQLHERMKNGLTRGINDRLTIMAQEAPPLPAVSGEDDELDRYNAEWFDAMIKLHPECNLVLTLIGLPHDIDAMKFWDLDTSIRPKLVVAFGAVYELYHAVKSDHVAALVANKPSYQLDLDDPTKLNPMIVFNRQYLLVNKNNIDQVAQENPGLFKTIR